MPPEKSGVRRTVAVLGGPGQVGAVDCFPGTAAVDRGGVDEPNVIVEQTGADTQVYHDVLHGSCEFTLAFVVARLLRNVGKDTGQMVAGVSDEASFRGKAEQGFHDHQDDEFRVADPGWEPGRRPDG